MAKKVLMVLVIAALASGAVFAQEDAQDYAQDYAQEDAQDNNAQDNAQVKAQAEFKEMAKNTVTVDFFPLIEGLAIGAVGNMIGGDSGVSTTGFGLAAQYERQLMKKFSVAGRFSYLMGGIGYADSYTDPSIPGGTKVSTSLGIDISSFAAEAHARYYPWGKTFFLDGMLGYSNMTVKLSGEMVGKSELAGKEEKVPVDLSVPKDFFTLGAKLGWRISFGRNGGFTFEPALGYRYGITSGDTVGKQLSKQVKDKASSLGMPGDMDIDVGAFDQIFGIIQDFVFVGGPYISLALGWRF